MKKSIVEPLKIIGFYLLALIFGILIYAAIGAILFRPHSLLTRTDASEFVIVYWAIFWILLFPVYLTTDSHFELHKVNTVMEKILAASFILGLIGSFIFGPFA
jgi:hypothetical protein